MSTPKYDSLEIDGLKYKTQFTEKFINRKKWEKPDPGAVITYIPGSIIDLYVKEGQKVKAGDLLCLLEAMKMHNKIQAPISGTVIKILYERHNVHACLAEGRTYRRSRCGFTCGNLQFYHFSNFLCHVVTPPFPSCGMWFSGCNGPSHL